MKTEARLRAAVEAGDFGPALALLPELRRELETALAEAPPGGAEAEAIAAAAAGLLEWARRAALAAKAHAAAELEALAGAGAYAGPRAARRSWEIDG